MPRKTYDSQPLVLGDMYQENGGAPVAFNMIDTSNLIDHLGAINLLIAAAPLLHYSQSATLFTDSLVKKGATTAAFVNNLLCGDFLTMSLLLGLVPSEYYANATGTSTVDEAMIDEALRKHNQDHTDETQRYIRLAWHRAPTSNDGKPCHKLEMKPAEVAHILYHVYTKMFQDEDLGRLTMNLTSSEVQSLGLPTSHRGSFITFLAHLRNRLEVDWNLVMETFRQKVEGSTSLLIGAQYLQELYSVMSLFDVYTVDFMRSPVATTKIPNSSSVCSVTLRIPRKKLRVFAGRSPSQMGTPPVHCVIQSPQASYGSDWQNFFACVQLTFGELSTKKTASLMDPELMITPDKKGWAGDSDLFVFFYAPQCVLSQEPELGLISFALKVAPTTLMLFMKDLGPLLKVYETTLGDKKNVFISRFWPNHKGLPQLCNSSAATANKDLQSSSHRISIIANPSTDTLKCQSLIGRLTLQSDKVKSILKNGAVVTVTPKTAVKSVIELKGCNEPFTITFPCPVVHEKCKTRIARTSSYIELEAPMLTDVGLGPLMFSPFPVTQVKDDLTLKNLPYLNLTILPIINLQDPQKIKWLTVHISLAFSSRERRLREKAMLPGATPAQDPRVNFKDGIFSMYMHYTGLQGGKAHVFGLNNDNQGGVSILIFVSCLRLDSANHTVVLDAAVLPLTPALLPKLHSPLGALTSVLRPINIDDEETKLWRHVLPAYVERARTWKHRAKCEYRTKRKIPLSLEQGTSPICFCGNGIIPKGFIRKDVVPGFESSFSKYCTRMAISPMFACPLVEISTDVDGPPSGASRGAMSAPTVSSSSAAALTPPFANYPAAQPSQSGDMHTCGTCGKKDTLQGVKLMTCAKCKTVNYCSKECQKRGWKDHKTICGR